MHRVSKIPVVRINPLLLCKLCNGYLIDATTIVECLHSFCRSCILSYLKLHITCPVCETLLHKTRPHCAIRPDRALQAIVYKLIPNLFENEMSCRRNFFKDHCHPGNRSLSPEKRGEISLNAYVLQVEEHVSIELTYWQPTLASSTPTSPLTVPTTERRSTYLLCPPELTVGHLEKLIRVKFGLEPHKHEVALFFSTDDLFNQDYTLSDLASLCSWRRLEPMRVYFTILQKPQSGGSLTAAHMDSPLTITKDTLPQLSSPNSPKNGPPTRDTVTSSDGLRSTPHTNDTCMDPPSQSADMVDATSTESSHSNSSHSIQSRKPTSGSLSRHFDVKSRNGGATPPFRGTSSYTPHSLQPLSFVTSNTSSSMCSPQAS